MRNRFRVFLIVLLTGGIVVCLLSCRSGPPVEQSALPSDDLFSMDNAIKVPAGSRYIDEVFEDVAVTEDIPFGQAVDYQGQEQTLLLDIYSPKGDTEKNRPAIIFVHGGGFTECDKDGGMEVSLGTAFARKGYVCASINYRLRDDRDSDWDGTFGDAVTDAHTALQWFIDHSADYGIDPDRIALSGHSAGAITVTGLAYNDGIGPPGTAGGSVFAVVNMSGGAYGLGDISPDAPPCLIIHGSEDDTVPFIGAAQCSEALTAAGVENTFYVMDGISHDVYNYIQEIEDVLTIFLYEELTGIKPDIPIREGS